MRKNWVRRSQKKIESTNQQASTFAEGPLLYQFDLRNLFAGRNHTRTATKPEGGSATSTGDHLQHVNGKRRVTRGMENGKRHTDIQKRHNRGPW